MIQHFRKKFIVFSTCALVVVVLTIVGSISAITYWRARQEVNTVLTILSDNEGRMPIRRVKSRSNILPQPPLTRESFSQYRFFSAALPADGGTISIDNRHILTVSPGAIRRLAKRAANRENSQGHLIYHRTVYAYKVKRTPKQTVVVFLDESLLMMKAREIIYIGLFLGLISLILYTTILILFSRRAIRPIIQAERRQKEFITNAGHELKTPLTVISANTEMQELTSGETELTASTKDQVDRMTKLINYLVSLARIQEQPQLNIVPVNASAVVERVVAGFKNVITNNGCQFKQSIAPDVTVAADENYLYELVSILVDNAGKYCDPGGTVMVTLERTKRQMVLTIANSYAKGDQVDTSRFFDRFYREDKARTVTKKAGYGIGLSMAQTLVHNFRGRINVKYAHGQIFFVVTLRLTDRPAEKA